MVEEQSTAEKMTPEEKMIWAAAYALAFDKRTTAAGAGQAVWDLTVAGRSAAIAASEAVYGARQAREEMARTADKASQAYVDLCEMTEVP